MSTRLGRAVSRLLGAFCLVLPALLSARPALPPEVAQALQRARVPEEALSVVIEEAGTGRSVLAWQEDRPVNPASLMKLVTTYAALDRFGPAWSWRTPVWLLGEVRDGVLEGSLVIRGSGDPTLVLERVWLMLRRVQQLGVREIRGDIVIDSSAFELPDGNPGDFDGEALRPYNTRPDALLLNFKTVTFGFVPDAATGRARVTQTPALAGAEVDRSVPLRSVRLPRPKGVLTPGVPLFVHCTMPPSAMNPPLKVLRWVLPDRFRMPEPALVSPPVPLMACCQSVVTPSAVVITLLLAIVVLPEVLFTVMFPVKPDTVEPSVTEPSSITLL